MKARSKLDKVHERPDNVVDEQVGEQNVALQDGEPERLLLRLLEVVSFPALLCSGFGLQLLAKFGSRAQYLKQREIFKIPESKYL